MQQAIHPDPNRRFQSASAMKEVIFNQCGEISLNAAHVLADFIQQHFGENDSFSRKDASDLPTYVSETVSKYEMDTETTQETSKNYFLQQAKETELTNELPARKEPPNIPQMIIYLIIFVAGILFGVMSFGFNIKSQAELRIYFPTEVSVSVNGEDVSSSGSRVTVAAEQPIKALVTFSNGTKRELDVQLSSGESRIIYIEHLQLQ